MMVLLLVLGSATVVFAQTQSLTITKPSAEFAVLPGDVFNVTVVGGPQLPTNYFDGGVYILSPGPITSSNSITSNPFTFTVNVAPDAAPGRYALTAVGKHIGASPLFSASLFYTVKAAGVSNLEFVSNSIVLQFVGDTAKLDVGGRISNRFTLMPATEIVFQSINPLIASVDSSGQVTGLSAGRAKITASFSGSVIEATVTVNGPGLRGDLNSDGIIDQDDLNILRGALNQPINTLGDARDLNKDGKIDALDLRILSTLCTRARCATQ